MDELRVSTITAILKLSSLLDLEKIYYEVPISKTYIPFIEYGADNEPRGYSKKLFTKKRKNKKKKIFYNQATIHVIHDKKIMNVKLFNNGKIQITGLKKPTQGIDLINTLLDYFKDIDMIDNGLHIVTHELVLINSDFSMGYEINRMRLHREIINSGMYSSFEPCIYPGVNIKYYVNTGNCNGICQCSKMCDGKGKANGDGDCKKVTIAVFKSGKIIITGAQNYKQLETSHQFIKSFINSKQQYYLLNL